MIMPVHWQVGSSRQAPEFLFWLPSFSLMAMRRVRAQITRSVVEVLMSRSLAA